MLRRLQFAVSQANKLSRNYWKKEPTGRRTENTYVANVHAQPMTLAERLDGTIERGEIEARILKYVRYYEKINLREFSFKKSFDELGLDSLERVSLITGIESEFSTVFTDHTFDSFKNIDEIVDIIAKDRQAV